MIVIPIAMKDDYITEFIGKGSARCTWTLRTCKQLAVVASVYLDDGDDGINDFLMCKAHFRKELRERKIDSIKLRLSPR